MGWWRKRFDLGSKGRRHLLLEGTAFSLFAQEAPFLETCRNSGQAAK